MKASPEPLSAQAVPPAAGPFRVPFAVTALAAVVGLGFAAFTGHLWEDYFITFRSSLNLATGYGLLNRGPANERCLARSPFFREPGGTLRPVWSDEDMILLAIDATLGE